MPRRTMVSLNCSGWSLSILRGNISELSVGTQYWEIVFLIIGKYSVLENSLFHYFQSDANILAFTTVKLRYSFQIFQKTSPWRESPHNELRGTQTEKLKMLLMATQTATTALVLAANHSKYWIRPAWYLIQLHTYVKNHVFENPYFGKLSIKKTMFFSRLVELPPTFNYMDASLRKFDKKCK